MYCEMTDPKLNELWHLGFEALQYPKFYGHSSNAFLKIIESDKKNCDAYFMAGYTFRLRNMTKDAAVYYYIADSLAQNRSIEFKQNLAGTCIALGNIKLARKKYLEIAEFFPLSPEGYYGIALTSTMIGDSDKGLENMYKAVDIYKESKIKMNDDTELLLAILLTLNKKYLESLEHFDKCYSKYKKDDNFSVHYSYSLLKVSELNNDDKMKKKALKIFEKIKNKDEINEDIKMEFKI